MTHLRKYSVIIVEYDCTYVWARTYGPSLSSRTFQQLVHPNVDTLGVRIAVATLYLV